jgi:large subunit ribosomal protein L10
MNREQKAATIEALAVEIEQSHAVFAVDYRGISVPQAAELRGKLRDADATFRVVKNSLTERAADEAGAVALKAMLSGPTALTFVRGDAALAAKAIADYARVTQLLPFKGGLMDGGVLDASQIVAISRLPSREALYGQLVGVVASPVNGLVRTLGALLGGLAAALGQVREKKESGEIPSGEPASQNEAAEQPPQNQAVEQPPQNQAVEQAPQNQAVEEAPQNQTDEPASEPAQDDNQADASAQQQADDAEATKEDKHGD